jgi:hypothetical protein
MHHKAVSVCIPYNTHNIQHTRTCMVYSSDGDDASSLICEHRRRHVRHHSAHHTAHTYTYRPSPTYHSTQSARRRLLQ